MNIRVTTSFHVRNVNSMPGMFARSLFLSLVCSPFFIYVSYIFYYTRNYSRLYDGDK